MLQLKKKMYLMKEENKNGREVQAARKNGEQDKQYT